MTPARARGKSHSDHTGNAHGHLGFVHPSMSRSMDKPDVTLTRHPYFYCAFLNQFPHFMAYGPNKETGLGQFFAGAAAREPTKTIDDR